MTCMNAPIRLTRPGSPVAAPTALNAEPSHIHIPRPSRLAANRAAARDDDQAYEPSALDSLRKLSA